MPIVDRVIARDAIGKERPMTEKTTTRFTGFPDGFSGFLRELGTADKAWFERNRGDYQDLVVAPTKAFVVALGERLARDLSPAIVAQPKTNGSISPITNDLRFSPDKNPYKDHLLLRFWEGDSRKTSPTLFVRIGVDDVGFATGAPIPSVDRWRDLIDDEATGAPLAAALSRLAKGRDLDIAGQEYKRVPKPFAEDHSRADLLRHKSGIQARWSEPAPASIGQARFVDLCARRLGACGEVHRWLVDHL